MADFTGYRAFSYRKLHDFCLAVFLKHGFTREESAQITEVLLAADLAGIESHGIQRLVRYSQEIGWGLVKAGATPEVVFQTPLSAVIDAHDCMGQLVSVTAMNLAVTKAKAHGIGLVTVRDSNHFGIAGYYTHLAARQDLDVVIARPGNHTGPGQSPKFVAPAFAHALRDFRDGRLPSIAVGNLDSERDFSDVRDVVAAYVLLLEKGARGGIYNISAGEHVRIGDLLTALARIAGVSPVTHVEPARFRPTDAVPVLDTAQIRALGWRPAYPLERTLADLWRETETGASGKSV